MPCSARLCAQAPGAVRLRRYQANLRQLHRALLQAEHARADQTGDALGRPAHAMAPPGAGGPAHSRRPSAGANPSTVAIARVARMSAASSAVGRLERSETHHVTALNLAMTAGLEERPWTRAARRWVSQVLNPS